MPELLKDKFFNNKSVQEIASGIKSVYPSFKSEEFLKSVLDETWAELELKARGRKVSLTVAEYLPSDYKEALTILEKSVTGLAFAFFLPDFVEVFGQDEAHWEISINALEKNTENFSSEFAVRPFIIKNEERMMARMYAWSKHKNEHIRRLSSEGCRPMLPWAQALPKFKNDPTPILPILEQLKTDPSLYVRKSVANNINDISKTNPDLVKKLAKEWHGKNERTDWILKHGCRSLLKKGDREVLALFGYHDVTPIDVEFGLQTKSLLIGEDITFSFNIEAKEEAKVRLEYGIDYVKSSGKRSRKIFQISEITLKKNEKKSYNKDHAFADLSTRKHYPGTHSITLIVNGLVRGTYDFELKA